MFIVLFIALLVNFCHQDCIFDSGIAGRGGAAAVSDFAWVHFRRCTFVNNLASNGGAISCDGEVSVYDSIFLDNTARATGGAVTIVVGSIGGEIRVNTR